MHAVIAVLLWLKAYAIAHPDMASVIVWTIATGIVNKLWRGKNALGSFLRGSGFDSPRVYRALHAVADFGLRALGMTKAADKLPPPTVDWSGNPLPKLPQDVKPQAPANDSEGK